MANALHTACSRPFRDSWRGAPLSPPVSIRRLPCGRRRRRPRRQRVQGADQRAAGGEDRQRWPSRSLAERGDEMVDVQPVGVRRHSCVGRRTPPAPRRPSGPATSRATRRSTRSARRCACARQSGKRKRRRPASAEARYRRRSGIRWRERVSGPWVVPLERNVRWRPAAQLGVLEGDNRHRRNVAPVRAPWPASRRAGSRTRDRRRSGRTGERKWRGQAPRSGRPRGSR